MAVKASDIGPALSASITATNVEFLCVLEAARLSLALQAVDRAFAAWPDPDMPDLSDTLAMMTDVGKAI